MKTSSPTPSARWEELLLDVGAGEDDAELDLPAPLAGSAALQAVRRLWDVVAPTQGERARAAGLGRMLAPDGRHEHVPLRLVDVDPGDVETLAAAAQLLGDPHADDWIRDFLDDFAHQRQASEPLVMQAAQLAGLLALADTAESVMLRERLAAADLRAGGLARNVPLRCRTPGGLIMRTNFRSGGLGVQVATAAARRRQTHAGAAFSSKREPLPGRFKAQLFNYDVSRGESPIPHRTDLPVFSQTPSAEQEADC